MKSESREKISGSLFLIGTSAKFNSGVPLLRQILAIKFHTLSKGLKCSQPKGFTPIPFEILSKIQPIEKKVKKNFLTECLSDKF